MSTLNEAAKKLWQSRLDGSMAQVSNLPQTVDEAYALQRAGIDVSGQKMCGYKIGATSVEIQELLGLSGPFYGPVFAEYCRDNKATIKVHESHGPKVEPEVVISIGKDIDAGSGEVTDADVRECIDWIAPAFEIVSTRWADVGNQRGNCVIADFGSNHDLVIGEHYTDWRDIDLGSSPVTLSINGDEVAKGHTGLSIAGNPVSIVTWLVNHPGMRSIGLKKGEVISCGTCTDVKVISPGDHLVADYGKLGSLEVNVVAN